MPKTPSQPGPDKKPARPPAPERFISHESHMRIIKKGGRTFVVEFTKTISEIKTTNNNVIEFPAKRGKAMINGKADKTCDGHF
jgi:hypothetical protein